MSTNDQLGRIARQGQDAVNGAVKVWADSVQRLTGGAGSGQVPDVSAVVDSAFDFAERMLHTQREFTKAVLQAVQGTAGRVTEAAAQGVDQTVSAGSGAGRDAAAGATDLADRATASAAQASRSAAESSTSSGSADGGADRSGKRGGRG